MAISLSQFDAWMNSTLRIEELAANVASDPLHNGLQTRGTDTITKVGFGVSANMRLFELAAKEGCQAIVVHHGLPIAPRNIDRLTYERMAFLIRHNISLWSAHYLLDAHPIFGNNAQIITTLGGTITEPYPKNDGIHWGYVAELQAPQTLQEILLTLDGMLSPTATIYDFGPKTVQKIVVLSGKGAPGNAEMDWLMENGIDLYITGEIHEWNQELFREAGIHCIAGGHYHSELFGIRAIHTSVDENLDTETLFLDVPNNT